MMRTSEAVTRATKRQLPTILAAAVLLVIYLVGAALCDRCLCEYRCGGQVEIDGR